MSKISKRIAGAGVAAALLGGSAFAAAPAYAAGNIINPDWGADIEQVTGPQIVRFADKDRVGTAIEAALSTNNVWWQNPFFYGNNEGGIGRTVIIASSEQYPDALAAAPLADTIDAPVLLNNDGDEVDARVLAYLRDQGIENVLIASGTGVLTPDFQAELTDEGYNTFRVAGVNRNQTAAVLAAAAISTGFFPGTSSANVFLADGQNFPDALAAGATAAQYSGVVLLTDGASGLSKYTYEFLEGQPISIETPWFGGNFSLARQEVYTVGGAATTAAPKGYDGNVLDSSYLTASIVGSDRYETATLLADKFFGPTPSGDLDDPYWSDIDLFAVASGENFADAVVAGAWAANVDGPLLLSQNAELNADTEAYLVENVEKEDTIAVFGGTGSISTQVSTDLKNAFDF